MGKLKLPSLETMTEAQLSEYIPKLKKELRGCASRPEYPQLKSYIRKAESLRDTMARMKLEPIRLMPGEKPEKPVEAENLSPFDPRTWGPFYIDRFLDSWWRRDSGSYNYYHNEYQSKGRTMVIALHERNPGSFQYILDGIAELEFQEYSPKRPRGIK